MKQTAVEWLDEQLQDTMYIQYGYVNGVRKVVMPLEDYMRLKQVALEMEKEQIIDAFDEGKSDGYKTAREWDEMVIFSNSEQYYNETYKEDKQ